MVVAEKGCCVTGHRDIPRHQVERVEQALRREVRAAIEEGYTRFISGFAPGVDLMFAAIVVQEQASPHQLRLEAAIPYAGRMNTKNPQVQELLQACSCVKVMCQHYQPACYMQRNRFMVECAQRVLAVYDGRAGGGTRYTMDYAYKMGRDVRVIALEQ